MKRLIVIFLILFSLIFIGYSYYQYKTAAIECWFTTLYPSFVVGFDEGIQVSALDKDYYVSNNIINYKIAIVEWFKNVFNFVP